MAFTVTTQSRLEPAFIGLNAPIVAVYETADSSAELHVRVHDELLSHHQVMIQGNTSCQVAEVLILSHNPQIFNLLLFQITVLTC